MNNNNNTVPALAVIIPTYNSENYIEEAINSVLKQPPKDVVVIVVNDGSTDNTLGILQKKQDNTLILGILRMNAEQSCRSSKPNVISSALRKNLIKSLAQRGFFPEPMEFFAFVSRRVISLAKRKRVTPCGITLPQTSYAAQVALWRCPILRMSKASL